MSLSDDYLQRFGGIARLYGSEGLERLAQAHVLVVGIGGVGSWVAESLARSGIGCISLLDLDDLCLTNINRQIHALTSTISKSKVRTMAHRLLDINPEIRVYPIESFLTLKNTAELLSQPYHLIIDAIDSVREKSHLIATARDMKRPIITIGGMGGRVDPARLKTSDLSLSEGDRVLMLVRKKLRSEYQFPRPGKGKFKISCVYSDEPPVFPNPDGTVCPNRGENTVSGINCDTGFGSITHITATAAFHATALGIQLLLKPTELPRNPS